MAIVVLPLGLLAGALTTVAGVGGGMLLVLALSVVWDPATALAVTAPALLVGNLHRLVMLRSRVERGVALRLVAGALPASLLGGLLVATLPSAVLAWLLVATAAAAVAREAGWLRVDPPRGALVPVGAAAGLMTATTGGGGLLMAPVLLASGLRGEVYVATGAAIATCMHLARIVAYGAGGLIAADTLLASLLLAVAIVTGNLVGRRLRRLCSEEAMMHVTWGTLAVAIGLAVAGVV